MTAYYAGYNALRAQDGLERLGSWVHDRRRFVEAQKVQPKGKTGRADIALISDQQAVWDQTRLER
nr:IS66 family transposase [Pseudomonas viridiflava]